MEIQRTLPATASTWAYGLAMLPVGMAAPMINPTVSVLILVTGSPAPAMALAMLGLLATAVADWQVPGKRETRWLRPCHFPASVNGSSVDHSL